MSDELIRKYSSKDLLELQNTSVALADKSFKVFWFNKSFKKDIGSGKIKGASLKSLFNINTPDKQSTKASSKSFVVPLSEKNKNIVITPIYAKSKKNEDAFLIELLPIVDSESQFSAEQEKLKRNLLFQNDLQSLLVLLVREKSISSIAEEILSRCVNITNSDFGIIAFHSGKEVENFIYIDPSNHIINKIEVEKSIKSNSSFINKWLEINKRPLLALNQHNNIGYGLAQVLNCE
jgi:hypothetical protein